MTRPPTADLRRALSAALVRALLPALVLLAAAAVAARAVSTPLGTLVREATSTSGQAFYAGGLAAITVCLWTAAAAVALAATLGRPWRDRAVGGLLVVMGLLSLALALDDQFRLHEDVLPRVGVTEEMTYAGYAVLGLVGLIRARAAVRARPDTVVLVASVGLLGLSVGVDLVQGLLEEVGLSEDARVYVEDGLKLCGAAVWLRWVVLLSRDVHEPTGAGTASDERAEATGG